MKCSHFLDHETSGITTNDYSRESSFDLSRKSGVRMTTKDPVQVKIATMKSEVGHFVIRIVLLMSEEGSMKHWEDYDLVVEVSSSLCLKLKLELEVGNSRRKIKIL